MAKTTVICIKLFRNFVCQKLSKSANFSRSYSKNKSGTVFLRLRVRWEGDWNDDRRTRGCVPGSWQQWWNDNKTI